MLAPNSKYSGLSFQSSLPRGERQVSVFRAFLDMPISILAPARGATRAVCRCDLAALRFQSSLPRGERQAHRIAFPRDFHISILAPARGATPQDELLDFLICNFNPRSREGSDKG